MIYIDVTSAAASSMNTGVQRAIRGIHDCLRADCKVVPLRWDFAAKRYATLSCREMQHLTHPFGDYKKPIGRPDHWDFLKGRGVFSDWWSRAGRGIPNESLLRSGELMLIPDLCWDKRIHQWDRIARLPGRKIAVFHDAMPLRISGQSDSKDELFAEYVRKLSLMDLVICISREVEEDLHRYWKQYGTKLIPTAVLPWPVPFSEARPENPPNRLAVNLIYVSRLRLRKNHLVLLAACERLWSEGLSFSLDLIGIADAVVDTFRIVREVRRLARQGHHVRWRRHVSDEQLHAAYRDCSFTLFPSRMEGFGLPILESLWHRRPVICGSNGAIGEVSAGGGCFQVDQNDPSELAEAIRSLLTDENVYLRLYGETEKRAFRSWADYRLDLERLFQLSSK